MSKQGDILNSVSDLEFDKDTNVPSDTKSDNGDTEGEESATDDVIIGQAKHKIQESLTVIQSHINRIRKLLNDNGDVSGEMSDTIIAAKERIDSDIEPEQDGGKVIEGVFDGQMMIGPDGKKYQIPPNYASKSKLVEGDILKLTITENGSFIYKQIGPIERIRVVGILTKDVSTGDFRVKTDSKMFKVLAASVTYFKGEEGDSVTIIIPKNSESNWAAVENIIGKTSS